MFIIFPFFSTGPKYPASMMSFWYCLSKVDFVYSISPAPLYTLSVLPQYTSSHRLHCTRAVYYLSILPLSCTTATYLVGRQETIRVALQIQCVMMIHIQMPKC